MAKPVRQLSLDEIIRPLITRLGRLRKAYVRRKYPEAR
jgi:hypothetical protein